MPTVATFDFDHPQIRIVAEFPDQARFGYRWLDPVRSMRAKPSALAVASVVRRPRRKERNASVESVQQDINGAGFRRAAPPKHRVGAFRHYPTQVRGDPDVGAKARRAQREPEAFAAALSSLTRCGVTSVDIGKPRVFSKSCSAAAVSEPRAPVLIAYPSLTRSFCAAATSRGESLFPPEWMRSAIGSAVRAGETGSFVARSPKGRGGGAGGAAGGGSETNEDEEVGDGGGGGSIGFLTATEVRRGFAAKNGEGWRACCSVSALTMIPAITAASAATA